MLSPKPRNKWLRCLYLTYLSKPCPQFLPATGYGWHTPHSTPKFSAQGLGCPSLSNAAILVTCPLFIFCPLGCGTWFPFPPSPNSLHDSGSCPLWMLPDVPAYGYALPFTYTEPSPPPYPGAITSFLFLLFIQLVHARLWVR